jgi:hypothetical protein
VDTISVLTSGKLALRKVYDSSKGETVLRGQSTSYSVSSAEVSNFDELCDILKLLSNDKNSAIIRGELKSEFLGTEVPNRYEYFSAHPRQWAIIDIDGLSYEGDINNLDSIFELLLSKLPIEFSNTAFWFNFSSNMGLKPGIRVHLGFWLSRHCSDTEMRAWLDGTVADLSVYSPNQLLLTCAPIFPDGIEDPVKQRNGLYAKDGWSDTVCVPTDLSDKAKHYSNIRTQRARLRSGEIALADIIFDPDTGLVIDGREQLLFHLSLQETETLLRTSKGKLDIDELTSNIWERFHEEADLSESRSRAWSIAHARDKAQARIDDVESGRFTFKGHGKGATYAVPVFNDLTKRPNLLSNQEAKLTLDNTLEQFFDQLASGNRPRTAVQITMGTGKTTATIEKLKEYLANNLGKVVEVYLPRHDLIDEWSEILVADTPVRAEVCHIKPRESSTGTSSVDGLCLRPDYVKSLRQNGYAIYSHACAGSSLEEQCEHFDDCPYINQFRVDLTVSGNRISLYTHTSLFLERNPIEGRSQPDLVVIDESFFPAMVSGTTEITTRTIERNIRTESNRRLGRLLIEAIEEESDRAIEYLIDEGMSEADFAEVDLSSLAPNLEFNSGSRRARNLPSVNEYHALRQLIDIVRRELRDSGRTSFNRLEFVSGRDSNRDDILRICAPKPCRISPNTAVLYLDASAEPLIYEQVLTNTELVDISVEQRAIFRQVYDSAGSNQSWKGSDGEYKDIQKLLVLLKQWIIVGERPLLVGTKDLCDWVKASITGDPYLETLDIAHFQSLRGTDQYKDCTVAFIVGRNQPPYEAAGTQARIIFGSQEQLNVEAYDDMPTETKPIWLSKRYQGSPIGIKGIKCFSDPRVQVCLEQAREEETLQAIARLRLVWTEQTKNVYLLSNVPVGVPVDQLIQLSELIPNILVEELLEHRHLALTAASYQRQFLGERNNLDALYKRFQRMGLKDIGNLISALPSLYQTACMVVEYKAGKDRLTTHRHIYLPERFSFKDGVAISKTPELDTIQEMLNEMWKEDGGIKELSLSPYTPFSVIDDG